MKPAVAVALIALAVPAWGQMTPDVDALVGCAVIAEGADRLACFDRELAPALRARAAAAAPPVASPSSSVPSGAIASRTIEAQAVRETVADRFGEEQLAGSSKTKEKESSEVLQARVTALRAGGSGTFLVILDNGQVWRHEDSHQGGALQVGDAITIRRGAIGSYRLTRDAGQSRNWLRVTRVR